MAETAPAPERTTPRRKRHVQPDPPPGDVKASVATLIGTRWPGTRSISSTASEVAITAKVTASMISMYAATLERSASNDAGITMADATTNGRDAVAFAL